jgi:hypothetical protein
MCLRSARKFIRRIPRGPHPDELLLRNPGVGAGAGARGGGAAGCVSRRLMRRAAGGHAQAAPNTRVLELQRAVSGPTFTPRMDRTMGGKTRLPITRRRLLKAAGAGVAGLGLSTLPSGLFGGEATPVWVFPPFPPGCSAGKLPRARRAQHRLAAPRTHISLRPSRRGGGGSGIHRPPESMRVFFRMRSNTMTGASSPRVTAVLWSSSSGDTSSPRATPPGQRADPSRGRSRPVTT